MILPDTSVWVDHFRAADDRLQALLEDSQILAHPVVIGEIACGNLRDRGTTLRRLQKLPFAVVAGHAEALRLLEDRHFWGRGIGWMDVHLLASALLTGCRLWTRDRRLREAARLLRVDYAEKSVQ